MNNTTVVDNLEALLAAVEAQPETLFDLSSFRKDTSCGSNFCTAGLACTLPRFQALGFKLEVTGERYGGGLMYTAKVGGLGVYQSVNGEDDYGDEEADVADFALGEGAWQNLFKMSGDGALDAELGYYYNWESNTANMTDKELAIARLKEQIELVKGEQE